MMHLRDIWLFWVCPERANMTALSGVTPKFGFLVGKKGHSEFWFWLINLKYAEVCLSTGLHYGSGPQTSKHVRTTWEHVRIQMLKSCLIPMKSDIQTIGARTHCFFGLSRLVHCTATSESQCFLETKLGVSWSPESRIRLLSSVVSPWLETLLGWI